MADKSNDKKTLQQIEREFGKDGHGDHSQPHGPGDLFHPVDKKTKKPKVPHEKSIDGTVKKVNSPTKIHHKPPSIPHKQPQVPFQHDKTKLRIATIATIIIFMLLASVAAVYLMFSNADSNDPIPVENATENSASLEDLENNSDDTPDLPVSGSEAVAKQFLVAIQQDDKATADSLTSASMKNNLRSNLDDESYFNYCAPIEFCGGIIDEFGFDSIVPTVADTTLPGGGTGQVVTYTLEKEEAGAKTSTDIEVYLVNSAGTWLVEDQSFSFSSSVEAQSVDFSQN